MCHHGAGSDQSPEVGPITESRSGRFGEHASSMELGIWEFKRKIYHVGSILVLVVWQCRKCAATLANVMTAL